MKTHHACKGTYGAVASLYKATWDTSSSSRYCPWAISPSPPDSVQWSTEQNIRENSASEIDASILLNSMGNDSARVPPFTLFPGISESSSNSSDPDLACWPQSCTAWEGQEAQAWPPHPFLTASVRGGCKKKKKEPVCLIHGKLSNSNQKPILPFYSKH